MRFLYLFIVVLMGVGSVSAQQLSERTYFSSAAYIWNPAMTGAFNYWEAGATYRQQWSGFNEAPRTVTLQGQYPFEDYNMSIGGFFVNDKILPLTSNTLGMNYAYKLNLGIARYDQLSIGLQAGFTQYFLDSQNILANDQDDILLPSGEGNQIRPNFGGGIYYTSYARSAYDESYFFFGLAAQQALPQNLIFDEFGGPANLKRALHGNMLIGGRLLNEAVMLEPSIWVNYSQPGIFTGNIGFTVERYETFWAGFNYSLNATLGVQAGYILTEKFVGDGELRIGMQGLYNIGSFGRFSGLGYEFFISYQLEQ